MDDKKSALKEIPEVVKNPDTGKQYVKGRFLGKGGFARCYELIDDATKTVYAGKIVPKKLLLKKHQREKMVQEIKIHRTLSHPHIVRCDSYFEDVDNVYVLLELCTRRSLMELHKRRKRITEPEARYFLKQVVNACQYLHSKRIIHRDLKLGNLFLNDDLEIKVGDFGLATVLDYDGERKETLCGTPNYIAPEMLDKKGHSYGVDIWAIGCILFTLLVGKPPFETSTLKGTYHRIKNNDYTIPAHVSQEASHLIKCLLHADHMQRPPISQVIQFTFFSGYCPNRLPLSCLTMAPKFASSGNPTERCVLDELLQKNSQNQMLPADGLTPPVSNPTNINTQSKVVHKEKRTTSTPSVNSAGDIPSDCYLSDLYRQLSEVVNNKPREFARALGDEVEDPAAMPIFWITKWVDYSDKYGLGYQLCDNSVGVLFNDNSKLILDATGQQVQYIDRDSCEYYYTGKTWPQNLSKKMTLLMYFQGYMNQHLQKTGSNMPIREGDELARLPVLRTWFRTQTAIVLHLSNGTVQINFFSDHTKLIMCPLMGAATYIDCDRNFRVLKLAALAKYDCSKEVFDRLKYARTMLERLVLHTKNPSTGADRR